MKALITGAKGFIGKNLAVALRRIGVDLVEIDIDSSYEALSEGLRDAEAVFHLAGINRPDHEGEFFDGNVGSLKTLLMAIDHVAGEARKAPPMIVLSSSIQATQDNPYGRSKLAAEQILRDYSTRSGAMIRTYRLPGVFGKWCLPNYNSVVATFCHNIARGLPINVIDPKRIIELVYIDDVVAAFVESLDGEDRTGDDGFCHVKPVFETTIECLAQMIQGFDDSRRNQILPDFSDPFARDLYSTYLSYLPNREFSYPLKRQEDERGTLAEVLKSPHFGQVFVSRTRPGITRGNHYHDSKAEKFLVLAGDAVVSFRHILKEEVIRYSVSGGEFRVVDIPPGYAHSLENTGQTDLIVLFWAFEPFVPAEPDTFHLRVK